MNRFFTIVTILFMVLTADVQAATGIHFEVSFQEPQAHYAEVKMIVTGLAKDYVDIKMPVWTPGSYLIREFAKNVEGLLATTVAGKPLEVTHLNKNTWRISAGSGDFIVNYRVYAYEISVRTPFVDDSHAFLSPAGIFMFPAGMIAQPSTVTVFPYKKWNTISTGLEPVSGRPNTFYASNFDILFDSPIEVGNQDVFGFTAGGVHYEVAMYGGGNYDKDRVTKDLPKIIAEETAIFGENPNKHYVFIVHNYNVGSGGLEHLNSCVLGVARFTYGTEAGYQSFLRLVAHEHFHLWNVKRLRPGALGPFDYDTENYTTNLWIAEGFTSFYDKLMMNRAGFQSGSRYLDAVLGDIRLVENQPGNKVQSAAEASFDAWIKQYRPGENSKNTTISYYNKGAIIATVMNLEILQATKGKNGLDDVMRAMYDEYYKKQRRGYTDAEFRQMAEKIAGKPLNEIYDQYVNGTAPVDYERYFGYAGLKLTREKISENKPYLGATLVVKEGKIIVTNVERGSTAWIDGLNVNDEILSIDSSRMNPVILTDAALANEADRAIASRKAGDKISVAIVRDGLMKVLSLTLKGNPVISFRLAQVESPGAPQQEILQKWIRLDP